ncbi:MAG: ATP-binding protein [Provencibacterium sp.]|jgi:predicted kinase|nr:ATP-binding protein [Provencibacterium sp.]
MRKPYLLIVTGRPGSGKSTFAKALGKRIHMPVVSRDELKEGYIHTQGAGHSELPPNTNKIVTDVFFNMLEMLVSSGVSVIAEAAFQHGMWTAGLEGFIEQAELRLLICGVNGETARERCLRRAKEDRLRRYFHGSSGASDETIPPYNAPALPVPTLHVDTSNGYAPKMDEIVNILFERDGCFPAGAPQNL